MVIGEYGFFPVEIKGWSGRILVGDRYWMVPWGRVPSPLAHLQKKTKALAHHIRKVLPELDAAIYSPGIFFPRGDVYLDGGGAMRRYVIEPDRLYDFFVRLDLIHQRGPGPLRSPEQIHAVVDAIVERAEPTVNRVDLPFYEVEEELERRGRAYREYIGIHKHLRSRPKVRIKAYTLDWLASQGSLQTEKRRLLRDMEALESLAKNPYVVQSYEMHPNMEEEAGFYVVSEWVGPMTLEIYLDEVADRSWSEREYLAAHLVLAVASIHREGTIHGNLHPRSIYFTEHYESRSGIPLKVADFDYAQVATFETIIEWEGSSDQYRPPGDWMGEGRDQGIDLYSLGVILFELLVGEEYRRDSDEDSGLASEVASRDFLTDGRWKGAIQGLLARSLEERRDAMRIATQRASDLLGNSAVGAGSGGR